MKKTKSKLRSKLSSRADSKNGARRSPTLPQQRTYSIPDYRLEKPNFTVRQIRKGEECHYEVSGDLSAPVPPIRDSKYLSQKQCIEIYRWMILNRKMETALENLYKQGKVAGGANSALAQEACPWPSPLALQEEAWLPPMTGTKEPRPVVAFGP